jgi:hypothetical protein
MIRHSQIQTKPLQSEAEHRPQCQRRRDRKGGVEGLPTWRCTWFSLPRCDRLLRESDGQAPALPQGSIVN